MQPVSLRVPGANGLSLHLRRWSEPGIPLLFLHGFDNDSHVWDEFAPGLAPHYQTLALDHRGHGDSEWDSEGRYDHETMAQDVEAVLETLDAERVVLVGHSLGGRVAMRFAGRNPEKMAGLVIVDVGPELDMRGVSRIRQEMQTASPVFASVAAYEDTLAQRYPETSTATLSRMARHWLRERLDGSFEPKTDPSFGRLRTGMSAADSRSWQEQEAAVLWAALERTPCPALVIRGAASDVFDADTADRMVEEALPNAQLTVIARAGHSVMLDNPKDFGAALTRFVLGDQARTKSRAVQAGEAGPPLPR